MSKRTDLNIELYCDLQHYGFLKHYYKTEALFKNFEIAEIYKELALKVSRFEYFKTINKINKESKIKRVFIKAALNIFKICCKMQKENVKHENLKKYDVFFSPVYKCPEFIVKNKYVKKYVMIHDLIPKLLPLYFPTFKKRTSWFSQLLESINKDDYYFANSEHTKQDFIKHIPQIDRNKIITTLLAASDDFYNCNDAKKILDTKLKYNIPKNNKYIFSLCSLEPRKNLIMTAKAFIEFIKKYNIDDFVYVLGGNAWKGFLEKIEEEIPNVSKYSDKIIKAGFIADEDLSLLYSGAEFFVYTSEYEGFGLPPLEAMKCGKAVITSNNSSLPEVVGDAGIMIAFDSLEQHIEAFEKLYFDLELRKALEQKALERAKDFSWQKCVDTMIKTMKKIKDANPATSRFPIYTSFEYSGKTLKLFEHGYNCGHRSQRMTERCLEMAVAKDWLNRVAGEVLEIGAVSPYYFLHPNIIHVCDPYDEHQNVTQKCSLFDLDLTGRNVLSISTIEHVAMGDYGLEIKETENPILAFLKIVQESKKCLISFPVGYNKMLDNWFAQKYADLKLLKDNEKLHVTLFVRNTTDNKFDQENNLSKIENIEYGPMCANAVVVIEK